MSNFVAGFCPETCCLNPQFWMGYTCIFFIKWLFWGPAKRRVVRSAGLLNNIKDVDLHNRCRLPKFVILNMETIGDKRGIPILKKKQKTKYWDINGNMIIILANYSIWDIASKYWRVFSRDVSHLFSLGWSRNVLPHFHRSGVSKKAAPKKDPKDIHDLTDG